MSVVSVANASLSPYASDPAATRGRRHPQTPAPTRNDFQRALDVVNSNVKSLIGSGNIVSDSKVSKVSVVGVGMRSHSGVAAKMFQTLATEGVNIDMISTSEIKISVIIDLSKGEAAMRAVHKAFLG